MRLMGDEVAYLEWILLSIGLYFVFNFETRFLLSYLHKLSHLYVLMCLDFVCLFSWLPIVPPECNSKVIVTIKLHA